MAVVKCILILSVMFIIKFTTAAPVPSGDKKNVSCTPSMGGSNYTCVKNNGSCTPSMGSSNYTCVKNNGSCTQSMGGSNYTCVKKNGSCTQSMGGSNYTCVKKNGSCTPSMGSSNYTCVKNNGSCTPSKGGSNYTCVKNNGSCTPSKGGSNYTCDDVYPNLCNCMGECNIIYTTFSPYCNGGIYQNCSGSASSEDVSSICDGDSYNIDLSFCMPNESCECLVSTDCTIFCRPNQNDTYYCKKQGFMDCMEFTSKYTTTYEKTAKIYKNYGSEYVAPCGDQGICGKGCSNQGNYSCGDICSSYFPTSSSMELAQKFVNCPCMSSEMNDFPQTPKAPFIPSSPPSTPSTPSPSCPPMPPCPPIPPSPAPEYTCSTSPNGTGMCKSMDCDNFNYTDQIESCMQDDDFCKMAMEMINNGTKCPCDTEINGCTETIIYTCSNGDCGEKQNTSQGPCPTPKCRVGGPKKMETLPSTPTKQCMPKDAVK